ncbi:pirin family protein [Nostoc sp.]|uniref:pirin family protein n=1 Tax=Nostoc sp. TaxID=1180 RepID=UPI0035942644
MVMEKSSIISKTIDSTPSSRKRRIIHRTWGERSGPITRLVSPSDLGEMIKPFVFLDYFEAQSLTASGFGWHPHSGIATITFVLSGEGFSYEDSTGKQGILPQGGVEWMRAGGGVWHRGEAAPGLMQGFQLWIALPPEQELAPAQSVYLAPHQVEESGAVRVVLGRYGTAKSPIAAPPSINYLVVQLKDKEHWHFEPDMGNTVCWVAVQAGMLHTDDNTLASGELVVFEESDAAIDFYAEGDTTFMLGSAIKHPHDLVLGYYSVHTSPDALYKGETEIKRLANKLRNEGRLH